MLRQSSNRRRPKRLQEFFIATAPHLLLVAARRCHQNRCSVREHYIFFHHAQGALATKKKQSPRKSPKKKTHKSGHFHHTCGIVGRTKTHLLPRNPIFFAEPTWRCKTHQKGFAKFSTAFPPKDPKMQVVKCVAGSPRKTWGARLMGHISACLCPKSYGPISEDQKGRCRNIALVVVYRYHFLTFGGSPQAQSTNGRGKQLVIVHCHGQITPGLPRAGVSESTLAATVCARLLRVGTFDRSG